MIDFAKVTVKAGDGGNGAGSFRPKKGKKRGKADGGSGGSGGDVYFEATPDLNTLEPFRFVKSFKAENGGSGLSNNKHGANGQDLVLKVPLGTQIRVEGLGFRGEGLESGGKHDVYDLVTKGQRVLAARGGQGGRGNTSLRDDFGRRPFKGEKGETGEARNLTLELMLLADVGLIGFPNAGKSTLISKLTHARPKIAPYPFTTLEPNLGVADLWGKTVVIADIPGLIEGASEGRGLGDVFLRHVKRTKVLIHLVDVSETGGKWERYMAVRGELTAYSKELGKKKEIIVFSKADGAAADVEPELLKFEKKRKKVILISAVSGLGLDDLKREILKKLAVREKSHKKLPAR